MIVDGKSVKTVNTKPISYKNVTVWAATTGKIYPIADAKIKNFLYKDYGFPIKRNNLLSTIPTMDHHFEISLQLWIESYNAGNRHGYSEALRFTATGKDCCSAGDRIPVILTNRRGWVHVASHVGTNGNYYNDFRLPVKTWINIVVKQYPENEKVR